MTLSLALAYLTHRQFSIWALRREGRSQAEIGRRLGVQRQGINEALRIIDSKLGRALREVAQSNRLDVRRVDTVNGILEAYSHAYGVPVVVSFTRSNGVQVWYLYEGRCESCSRRQACMNMVRTEAEERRIQLSEEDLRLQPTQLGKKIFSTITKTLRGG